MGTQVHSFAGIELEPANRCIRRGGETIHLRPKTFQVLVYLLESRDRIVSKAELNQIVWEGASVTENTLAQCIIELRKALGDDLKNPQIIKTLPKSGYRFMAEVHPGQIADAREPMATPAVLAKPRRRIALWVAAGSTACVAAAAIWVWTAWPGRTIPEPPLEEIARWRLNEGSGLAARDSAGHNPGRLFAAPTGGTPPHWAPGLRSSALSFGGGNFAEGALQLPSSSAVSIVAWVRPLDIARTDSAIFDAARVGLWLNPSGIQIHRVTGGPGCGAAVGCQSALQEARWLHITAVDEGPITNVGRIYLDGEEKASGVMPPFDGMRPGNRWRIGQALSGDHPFRGLMQDLRIYARPLQKLEVEAIFRCGQERPDTTIRGKPFYFLPVFAGGAKVDDDGSFANSGADMGGVQFAEQEGDCGVERLRGADLGQDLRVNMDLIAPRDPNGRTTEAGPYFRSRRAYPGDGIAGGASSGYWLKLYSDGSLKLWQLRPFQIIAVAPAPHKFDSTRFHHLEAQARGAEFRGWLDGNAAVFEQDGRRVEAITIQGTGPRHGTAGVAFSADANRGGASGQRVKNLKVEVLERR